MWTKVRPLLILLSVAFNLTFAAIWALHTLPARFAFGAGWGDGVWCPLHRRLGVTEAQWRQIEPQLVAFQQSAQAVCTEIDRARGELIDLIAAPEPDREAIRAKQEEVLAGQRRMQELAIGHLLAEKEALTAEQQRQLFDMLQQQSGCAGHGPMMGWMGPHAPRRPGGATEGR
jgi:Spy/CpxP family protein refolding chaperone